MLAAIAELGFSRNSMASALASGNTRTVGLVVPTLRNSLFVDIAERRCSAPPRPTASCSNWPVVTVMPEQQQAQLDFLDGARVSGLLLAPMQDPHGMIERLRRHGRPVVVLNYASPSDDVCTVLIDNERSGTWRSVTSSSSDASASPSSPAATTFSRSCCDARAPCAPSADAGDGVELQEITVDGLDAPEGAIAGQRIIAQGRRRADGVVAVTDMLGMAIIRQLIGVQLAVPEDVAVIGCDYNSGAWGGAIPLSSVAMRGEAMGQQAVQLLLQEIKQGSEAHVHQVVTLEPELVVRESTVGR